MKIIYAITTGGSTLDILGCFEDRTLAEAAVQEWRKVMDVYDDGWGIEELMVWDRQPTYWACYKMNRTVFVDGKVSIPSSWTEPIFEWQRDQPSQETTTSTTIADGALQNIHVSGSNKADVERQLDESTLRAIESIPAALAAAADHKAHIDYNREQVLRKSSGWEPAPPFEDWLKAQQKDPC